MTTDKIALIYEFNNNSSLFARVAEIELGKNNLDKSIEILEKGLQIYPNYPTAYFIYGKVLAIKGDFEKAKKIIKDGGKLLYSDEALNYYQNYIEKLQLKENQHYEVRRKAFQPGNLSVSNGINLGKSQKDDLDELSTLAEELNEAKMPDIIDESIPLQNIKVDSDNEQIFSETLAGIYLAQDNLYEALSIYEKLIELKPEKEELFRKKI